MLTGLLKRSDVLELLKDICSNNRYCEKKNDGLVDYQLFVDVQHVLFVFYEALFKYEVIIGEMYYFQDYLEQVDKLFKKLDNISDIIDGINRLIGKYVILKLDLKNIDEASEKEIVLKYVYEQYIVNGFFIHGYVGTRREKIKVNGFVPEEYKNNYDELRKVQEIFRKHGEKNIITKDFSKKEVSFTDSVVMGCYYAVNAPMYFYDFVCNNKYVNKDEAKSAYFKNDYDRCLKNVIKICNSLDMSEKNKNIVLDVFKKEWGSLDRHNTVVDLMIVPRKKFNVDNDFSIDEFILNCNEESLGSAIGKLFNNNTKEITYSDKIYSEEILFMELPGYTEIVKFSKSEISKDDEIDNTIFKIDDEFFFTNDYGKVSMLLLSGTVLIMFGVVLTIIMVYKGM